MTIESFPIGQPPPDRESYRARVERYEATCANLVPIIAAGVYCGDEAFDRLCCHCSESLGRLPFQASPCYPVWDKLRLYPANFIAYAAGFAAIQQRRLSLLKTLLYNTTVTKEPQAPLPLGAVIGSTRCIGHDEGRFLHDLGPNTERKTPGSERMAVRLAPMLADVWGEDLDFDAPFDDFEFLLSLVRFDLTGFAFPGRFCWRGSDVRDESRKIESIQSDVKTKGDQHPLLLAGMFARSVERLNKAIAAVGEMSGHVRWQ